MIPTLEIITGIVLLAVAAGTLHSSAETRAYIKHNTDHNGNATAVIVLIGSLLCSASLLMLLSNTYTIDIPLTITISVATLLAIVATIFICGWAKQLVSELTALNNI